jgi:hypothetical protein
LAVRRNFVWSYNQAKRRAKIQTEMRHTTGR